MIYKRFVYVFILICGLLFSQAEIVLAEGTYAGIGTADGTDGSNDAINFSQGRVWTIDSYGKYIWMTQSRTGPYSHWAFSNDSGATWTQGSESYSFLTRASVAYDSINDKLHVIWAATDSNDGIIYRRYGITRDGSNNITAITREDSANVNLQLDTSTTRVLDQPTALWVNDGSANGILVATWSKQGGSLSEVRGSMRRLTITAADGVAGNWLALDGSADTFSTDAPLVAADKIYGSTSGSNGSSAKIRGGSGSRKDDLYVFVQNESNVLAYRGVWSSGSLNWSGGWQAPVTVGSATSSSGYNLKPQLITKPVIDSTNDRLYVGWARWKSVTDGDTVSLAYLSSSDAASTTIDVYSALGTHSYAPTLDIAYDAILDKVYVSYIQSTTNGDNGSIDYKTYDGTTLSSATRFYTSPGGSAGADGSADIPILYENRQNGRLLFAFRVNGAIPPTALDKHTIDWGYITLPTPTPTPTPTVIPTSTPSVSTSASSGPACSDSVPTNKPYMASPTVKGDTTIDLVFSSWDPYYTLEYGYSPSKFDFAVAQITGGSFSVGSLLPNTTYYFRVAVKNGCTIGPWSNVVRAKTGGKDSAIPQLDLVTPQLNTLDFGLGNQLNTGEPILPSIGPTEPQTPSSSANLEQQSNNARSGSVNIFKVVGGIFAGTVLVIVLVGVARSFVLKKI